MQEDLKPKIINLRELIDKLEEELETAQLRYIDESRKDGVINEEYGGYMFAIQPNPPRLDIEKKCVPLDLYKQAIDQIAVREYLEKNGPQSWGALSDEKPFKLVVKKIKMKG